MAFMFIMVKVVCSTTGRNEVVGFAWHRALSRGAAMCIIGDRHAIMNILLTGGAGFIGSHTACALLRRGDRVTIVDEFNDYYAPRVKRRNIEDVCAAGPCTVCEGDIRDLAFVRGVFAREQFDAVCHLAARAGVRPSIAQPFLYEQVNVLGTLHLLQLAAEHKIPQFVYASSSSVYGNMPTAPFREDMQLDQPISPYAATKKACELLAYTYHHLYGLRCIGLRFFTVYGPAGRPDMAPFIFTRNMLEGRPIQQFGDGSSLRDYTYIDDIVAGILASLDCSYACEIFNLGNCRPIRLDEFIRQIAAACGVTPVIERLPMQPGDVQMTCADTAKAQRLLGFAAKTPFEQGIRHFVNWYREHADLYR
jgi:UDP-glucuronate 4-epimerase